MSLETVVYDHVDTRVNHSTGEITETTKKQVVKREKTPEFIMLFTGGISKLNDARLTGTESQVLHELLRYVLPTDNMLMLNADVRKKIAKDIETTKNTLDKVIQKLQKTEILIKQSSTYFLNPGIFGRGDWNKIKKLRHNLNIEYDFTSNTMTSNLITSAQYDELPEIKDIEVVAIEKNISEDQKTIEEKVYIEDKKNSALNKLKMLSKKRLLKDEIISGVDARDIREKVKHENLA